MYNVYAIYNLDHNKIYVGQTKDLNARLTLHNNHSFKGYKSRFDGEWKLIYTEMVSTRQEALDRENS